MGGESKVGGTVVVCTRNRRRVLPTCLASLVGQTGSNGASRNGDATADGVIGAIGPVEVVVVDNGSTDGTGPWLGGWAAEDPGWRRVVFEPVAGLSRARNAGIGAARGEVVLFLDDDAVAPPGWVAAHLDNYRRDSGVSAVGGPVVLTWPNGRPGWLGPGLEHWFSALDHGDEAGPYPPPHGPYGTNMSLRPSVVAQVGGFTERLGRRGRSLLSSEEAELWHRVWAAGHRIVYDPATSIEHQVQASRLHRRWVLRRGWAQGRSNARRRTMTEPPDGRRALVAVCRADAGMAGRLASNSLRWMGRLDHVALIDQAARCAAHTSAVLETLWWWVRERELWSGAPRRMTTGEPVSSEQAR